MLFTCKTSFTNLTGKEISADIVKASAMEEGSHNELNEPQDSTLNNKLSSATDDIDTVMNYVSSSTNQELQTHCEHLNTVKEITFKEQQQRSVQTKMHSFFKPALLRSKTSKISESSINEQMCVLYFFSVQIKAL
jgi:vacuolar-type H+-ATPase subunit I/STV1